MVKKKAPGKAESKEILREKLSRLCVKPEADLVVLFDATVRVANHFDVSPDVFLLDSHLGSVGLVWVLEHEGESSGLSEKIEEFVDKATYLRHLLLNDPHLEKSHPFTVDLVLVDPSGDAVKQDIQKKIRSTLWRIVRETSFLHAVGVHTLPVVDGEIEDVDFYRAFSWLLTATKKLYQELTHTGERPKNQDDPAGAFTGLLLDSYRLHGKRRFALEKEVDVHLVHGHNGSGKSTIAEALELVMTGKIERLEVGLASEGTERESSYQSVIRNRDAGEGTEPEIGLLFDDAENQTRYVVDDKGVSPVPNSLLPAAASFRLDQTVMDDLCRSSDQKRAETFLASYFPDEEQIIKHYLDALKGAGAAFRNLPKDVRDAIDEEVDSATTQVDITVKRFDWFDKPSRKLSWNVVRDCLPLSEDALSTLCMPLPDLAPIVKRWPPTLNTLNSVLGEIDAELKKVREDVPVVKVALSEARDVLMRLNQWSMSDRSSDMSGFDYGQTLNEWLEATALCDLLGQQQKLVSVLRDARQRKWRFKEEKQYGLFIPGVLNSIVDSVFGEQLKSYVTKRRETETLLIENRREQTESGRASDDRPVLSNEDIGNLNVAGRWLLDAAATSGPKLGQLISQAIVAPDKMDELGAVEEGLNLRKEKWADGLITKIDALIDACAELSELPLTQSGQKRFECFKEVYQRSSEVKAASAQMNETFLKHISEDVTDVDKPNHLNHALCELMALFTPTRWNYEQVRLAHKLDVDGRSALKMSTDGNERADLRFNTAELNVFTVALFLACAVRNPNPLKLLVLDDPLQNMDELTSITVARGISKLVRLWRKELPDEWNLMLLFHGEDDLERFRRELPCAVYLLPGKEKNADEDGEDYCISADASRSRISHNLQSLEGVLEIRNFPGEISELPEGLKNLVAR